MQRNPIFKDFHEYWYYARYLSEHQRSIVFQSLSDEQRDYLNKSYHKGEWGDLFYRNEIDAFLDEIKDKYGYDLLELRIKILNGKSVYIPTDLWNLIKGYLEQYKYKDVKHILSRIKFIQCHKNPKVTLLISESSRMEETE